MFSLFTFPLIVISNFILSYHSLISLCRWKAFLFLPFKISLKPCFKNTIMGLWNPWLYGFLLWLLHLPFISCRWGDFAWETWIGFWTIVIALTVHTWWIWKFQEDYLRSSPWIDWKEIYMMKKYSPLYKLERLIGKKWVQF